MLNDIIDKFVKPSNSILLVAPANGNVIAQNFYKKNGFKELSPSDGYACDSDDEDYEDSVVLILE